MRVSKKMSWLLRHGANEVGLRMDDAGWASIEDVLRQLRLRRSVLDEVVEGNDKHRFEVVGSRIRASQGHSLAGTPVTVEGLERSWERVVGRTEPLIHGTNRAAAEVIRREGLLPMDRTHVHMASSADDKVGKRYRVQVLLRICPLRLAGAGLELFRSPNGVMLARRVPVEALLD
ncbi:MAG: RNA 2'-phosphotransferase [Myxococcales bacterium]|nr:RNA 2'-phosphotransferase [Myxococcales bacterium]